MAASNYERELKFILMGDKDTIDIVTKTCSEEEKEKYYKILKKPFIVVHAAGSYGVDLVGVRSDISLLIEIKSSKSKKIHFSSTGGKLQKQAERMRKDCERTGVLPIYAFRLKNTRGDAWRVFTFSMETNGLNGLAKRFYAKLPRLRLTKDRNLIMDWDEGMPLSDFIDMVVPL